MPFPPSARAALLAALLVAPAVLRAQAALAGRVGGAPDGAPLAGARVTLTGSSRTATTDREGRWRLGGLSAGEYEVTVSAIGWRVARRTVRLADGATARLDVALARGSLLLDQVVVAATRTAAEARTVSAPVTVADAARLRASPARTVDDLLRELPGVELPRTSSTVSGAEQIFTMRGGDEGRALVVLDGIPLTDAWGEWVQWNRVPRAQLDRVEVIPGAGTVYGSSAMGGTLALTTLPIARDGIDAVATAGARQATDLSLQAATTLGRAAVAVTGERGAGGGYTLLAPGQRGAVDIASTSTRTNVGLRGEVALGAGRSLFATLGRFEDARTLGTPLAYGNRRLGNFTAGASLGRVAGGRLELRTYGQDLQYDTRASVVAAGRATERPTLVQSIPVQDLGGSATWTRAVNERVTVTLGGDARWMKGRLDEQVFGAASTPLGTRTAGGTQLVGGAFAQLLMHPVAPLRLEAGVRLDDWTSRNGSRTDATTTPATTTAYPDKRNRAFAPRLGARWALTDRVDLRGTFYQGFRAPTLSELHRTFFNGPNEFRGNPALTPEYLTGWDAGVDWRALDRLELRATVWANDYRDLAEFTRIGPGAAPGSSILQRINVGKVAARGVQLAASVRGPAGLSLLGSYDYDDATNLTTTRPVNRIPLQRASARLAWSAAGRGLAAIWRYEGRMYSLSGLRMPPFAVLDVDARWPVVAGASLLAGVENLFDRAYTVNRAGTLDYLGLPRTVRAGLAVTTP